MKRFFLLIALFLLALSQVPLFSQEKKEKVSVTEELVLPDLNVIDNVLYVKNAPVGSRLEVITIVGNKVLIIEMKTAAGTYPLNLPKAIYIFKLEGVVRKFIVK